MSLVLTLPRCIERLSAALVERLEELNTRIPPEYRNAVSSF